MLTFYLYFLIIFSITKIVYTDQINSNRPVNCSTVRCANPGICSPGYYLVEANPKIGRCCNICVKYQMLHGNCEDDLCSPSLECIYNDSCNSLECGYSWELSYNSNCYYTSKECPRICDCGEDRFLIERDVPKSRCCDQCILYSRLGEYCDEYQKCKFGLKCGKNKTCLPSDRCESYICKHLVRNNIRQYILPRNGLTQCCDSYKDYSVSGEYCDDQIKCCGRLYCDRRYNNCTTIDEVSCSK